MKHLASKITILCLICYSFSIYSQDEFLENARGISLAYTSSHMAGINNLNSFGIAARTATGFSIAGQIAKYEEYLSPSVGFSYFTAPRERNNYVSVAFGLSYSYINSHSFIGMTTGPMVYLNAKKQFPTSINGRVSYSFDITPISNVYSNRSDMFNSTIISFGGGVHQAFFSDAKVFPYLCFNISYSTTSSVATDYSALYSVSLGININLDKK